MRFRVEAVLPAADVAGAWGDSVACALARNLDRYPDLSARCVSGLGRWLRTGSRIGVATANDEGRLRVRLRGPGVDTIEIVGPRAEWRFLAASLADRVFGAPARFPDRYQRLIRAQVLPLAARLDSLDALAKGTKDFLFGQFRRADELFHRGPLVGRSRREAMQSFQDVLKSQADFAPALEHVAWLD